MILNFQGADAPGIKGNDLILNTGHIFLVLLYDDWFEFAVPISGDGQLHVTELAADRFDRMVIAAVAAFFIGGIVLFIPQAMSQFRIRRLLEYIAEHSLRTRWMSSVVLMFFSWISVRSCSLLSSRLRSLSAFASPAFLFHCSCFFIQKVRSTNYFTDSSHETYRVQDYAGYALSKNETM